MLGDFPSSPEKMSLTKGNHDRCLIDMPDIFLAVSAKANRRNVIEHPSILNISNLSEKVKEKEIPDLIYPNFLDRSFSSAIEKKRPELWSVVGAPI